MSKNKCLNKHKGPLKYSTKQFFNRRFEVYEAPDSSKHEDFSYIALDSCAVINMAKLECKFFDTSFKNRKEKNLKENLEEIKKHSAIKNGQVCDRGKYVLCIVPAVLEEVDMCKKQFSETIQKHLKNMYLILQVKPEFQQQFDTLTWKIMREFEKQGLFVNGYGNFMEHDAKITAQAAIFNLAIASQDDHLISVSNGQRQHIKLSCAKHLFGDHNGHPAVPMALCEILNSIRNQIRLPELENSFILTDEVRKTLDRLKYKPSEYARPNPTLTALKTPARTEQFPMPFAVQSKPSLNVSWQKN